ncbi:hypothetical protein [Streptomyces sp. HUAS TT20]|uniref:hypothetical protein n=1 Tax=Streptomyces sp. HUAS TT20 TaxID=3447509 RepID=UPI0021DA452D|nr:hypothetical protein [Streptomyces sp. HUAS 15-9]UXY27838.1 hypothetical protein N8I87_15480 [Streptomyces sp. HUAS 15-9]
MTVTTVAAATLLLMGCGSQGGGAGKGGTVSPTTTPSPTVTATAADCARHFQLTAADNGRTICMPKGGQVRLTLDGTEERPWKPVTVTGDSLKAANPGIVILPGDAVAAYDAVAPGTAKLSSSRPLCAASPSPGRVSCKGIEEWTVTVQVR